MQTYQRAFLDFAIQQGVLRFGEFTLKSGRVSPYFFNAGLFNTGAALAKLGQFYAAAIQHSEVGYDMLFGPAYKGIPLVATAAIGLADQFKHDVPWCFNRKELKDHGEGGQIVGAALQNRVLLIDDVITAGTAIREAMQLLDAHQAQAAGVVIALDRQERGEGACSAIQQVEQDYNIPVIAIARLQDLTDYLQNTPDLHPYLPAVQRYREQYGVVANNNL